jgi:phosphatidylethanolamine/phosphatidyl-N-methylethanolamine N-methyltransferase
VSNDVNSVDGQDLWADGQAQLYESENYGPGLAGYVLRTSQDLVERPFGSDTVFPKVLEVGAGSGVHLDFVRHSYQEYVLSDSSDAMLAQLAPRAAGNGAIRIAKQSAAALTYPDASFDRLIAAHVLEHIVHPELIVAEWARVVKPGGVLSIVLPCDPGLAWRMGRYLGPRRRALKRGLDYDYVMAMEHVNSITNLTAIIGHFFPKRTEYWWPLRLPSTDLNLIYAVNIQV